MFGVVVGCGVWRMITLLNIDKMMFDRINVFSIGDMGHARFHCELTLFPPLKSLDRFLTRAQLDSNSIALVDTLPRFPSNHVLAILKITHRESLRTSLGIALSWYYCQELPASSSCIAVSNALRSSSHCLSKGDL